MRIATLNQIFGMLAVTATLCGTETALHSAFRGAMDAGAAGAAAFGAATYYHPYARPACGYYPYPPCY